MGDRTSAPSLCPGDKLEVCEFPNLKKGDLYMPCVQGKLQWGDVRGDFEKALESRQFSVYKGAYYLEVSPMWCQGGFL